MEILNDILKKLNDIDADNKAFKKVVPAIPKVSLNTQVIANEINSKLPDYSEITREFNGFKTSLVELKKTIPKEVKVVKEWRIEKFTLWVLAACIFGAVAGWYGSTTLMLNGVQNSNNEKLNKLERSIEEFRMTNPKTAEKYFSED